VFSVACGNVTTTSTEGPKIFATYCATCHGPTGKPPSEMITRYHVRDLTSAELRARVSPALVEHQVRTGSENRLMPSFEGMLSDDQIRSVAAYVADPGFVAPR